MKFLSPLKSVRAGFNFISFNRSKWLMFFNQATILGSLFITLLIVELVTADFIPKWVRKQMRRRRGRVSIQLTSNIDFFWGGEGVLAVS